MNLLDLMVKVGVDDQATSQIADIASKAQGVAGGVAKAGTAAVAAVGAAATGVAAAVTGAVSGVAEYGDNIEKMSQKMGMSFQSYQEWDAVMQHNGSSIEAVRTSMVTLAKQAESNSDAFQKLGISEQELQSLNQEQMFERVISGLQGMDEGLERTAVASELLGRGAKELGPLLNMSAEDTQAMRDRVHELGGVMSDESVKAAARFQDSLQDMMTAMNGIKRSMTAEFLPGVATVMDGLGNIFSGDSESGAAQVSEGVEQIVTKLREAVPRFVEIVSELAPVLLKALTDVVLAIAVELPNLVMQLVPVIIDLAPTFVEAGLQMFLGMVQALTESGPELIDKTVDVIFRVAEVLVQYAPQILEASLMLFAAILEALLKKLPDIVTGIVGLIGKLAEALVTHAPQILEAMGQVMLALLRGIANAVGPAMEAMNAIGESALNAIGGFINDMFTAGANLIIGFINGILSAPQKVVEAVTGVVGGAIDAAKRQLGIASPSKVFAGIGANTMQGLVEGIDGGLSGVQKAMDRVNGAITAQGSYEVSGGVSGASNATVGAGLTVNVYVEGRYGEDYGELGRRIGNETAFALKMQGVA